MTEKQKQKITKKYQEYQELAHELMGIYSFTGTDPIYLATLLIALLDKTK